MKATYKIVNQKNRQIIRKYYEKYSWIRQAIEREKEIKNLTRLKKWEMIKSVNPHLEFLNHLFEYNE